MPVHGSGSQSRSWLNVEDCAAAILTVLEKAPSGEIYNIGGNTEASVSGVVNAVADALGIPTRAELGFERAGIDLRYKVSDKKLRALGWEPQGDIWKDLPNIVALERKAFRW